MVTVRGTPMACLCQLAAPGNALERLVSEGLASMPVDDLSAKLRQLGPPLKGLPMSDRLAELRSHER